MSTAQATYKNDDPRCVTVTRNMRGELSAENEFPVPSMPGHLLLISTGKGLRRGLRTYAQVQKDEGRGCRSFVMFGDFRKAVFEGPTVRATEKAIAAQHSRALQQLDALMAEAAAFYAAKAEKETV